jgi:predicted ferric reductase
LSVRDTKIFKPYTQLVSLSNEVTEFRQNLIKLLDVRGTSLGEAEIKEHQFNLDSVTNELTFAIKPYNLRSGALSTKLVNVGEGSNIRLKGPFGSGLNLTDDFNGRSLIICLGTGILPFLDLFDFLLKKAIYQVFKLEG